MAEELSNVLFGRHAHANLSPEALELMGKKAANMFLNEGVSLNEGVAKLAAEHEDINTEQVKRICEFANTATHLALHDQSKTAGAKASYPQFDLADPGRVVQDLSDGARPTLVTPTDMDYGRQPEKQKTSSAKIDQTFEKLFGKQASEDLTFTKETAYREVVAAKDMLDGLEDHFAHAHYQFHSMHKEASSVFFDMTKRHMLGGGSFVDVLNAAKASGLENEKISSILEPHITMLLEQGVSTHKKLAEQISELNKTAHRMVDPNHPIVKTFKAMADLDVELEKSAVSLEEVRTQQQAVRSFMKENFSASPSR